MWLGALLLFLCTVDARFYQRDRNGHKHNSESWAKWGKKNHTHHNADIQQELAKYNDTVGIETDNYCIYDLRMQYLYGSPDGVRKRILGFNGQFPGPTLYCTEGKTMVVRVTNDIPDDAEPTSIHWHGIQQNLSPFYDGPQSITQCPVIRRTSMIYVFELFQSGTYWYHSHHSYQYVDGAWGLLVIKNLPKECWQGSYDEERLVTINDWVHRPARELSEIYLTQGIFPDVNSSLINGYGMFDCSKIEQGQTCEKTIQGPSVIEVTRGKRYRFRILNSSGARPYNFSIDGHKMIVIETDGVDTFKSPPVDIIPILAAQRYSILVTMDQPANEYWIRIAGEPGNLAGLFGRAVLRYTEDADLKAERFGNRPQRPSGPGHNGGYDEDPGSETFQGRPDFQDIPWEDIISGGGVTADSLQDLQQFFPRSPPKFDSKLQWRRDQEHSQLVKKTKLPTTNPVATATAVLLDEMQCPPLQFGVEGTAPTKYDRLIVINVTDCPVAGSPVRQCMNGQPFVPRSAYRSPVLYDVINGRRVAETVRPVFTPKHKELIRIVINNYHPQPHPWHMHGHSFWVLGHGANYSGPYVDSRDASKLTTQGVRRDTTYTNGNSWVVITYQADNPGAWFFHCHINWHLEAGLGMTFIEIDDLVRKVYKIPPIESEEVCAKVGVSADSDSD